MTVPLQVLMLDDEYDAVLPLVNFLRQAGHEVSYARDLSAALTAIEKKPIDWVFVDVLLDCTIPSELKDAYALLKQGQRNQGQALGMYLWMKRGQTRPDGSVWPGYAYLSNFSREHLAEALDPANQEFGTKLEQFLLSKFQIAGNDVCEVLEGCIASWKAL